jgi:predicted dehydrogenase
MTLRLDEALRLRQVQFANPHVLLQVGTQMMQLPKWKEAKRLLAEGAIGKPTMSQTSYCRNTPTGEWNYYGIDENWAPGANLDWDAWCGPMGRQPWDPLVFARWRRYRKYSTGIIGDLLVHVMTPMMYALDMGWPTRVIAAGGHYIDKEMENHDTVNLTIELEREHTMIVAGATNNENGLPQLIRGQKANMNMNGRHVEIIPEAKFVDDVDRQEVQCPDIGNDQDVHRLNWLHCIRTREVPAADVDISTKVMVVVDLATRSMWDGHAWRFDPYTMTAERV